MQTVDRTIKLENIGGMKYRNLIKSMNKYMILSSVPRFVDIFGERTSMKTIQKICFIVV